MTDVPIHNPSSDQSVCKRCGICCKKGGPSFHIEDRELIETGDVPLKDLYTIREGETVHDTIKGSLMQAKTDIIKIKSHKGFTTCIYYKNKGCTIHDNKPIECKTLKCWDTRQIEAMYQKNRLTRKDLLSGINGLWACVSEHQARCSYERIHDMMANPIESPGDRLSDEILGMIEDESRFRSRITEQRGTDPEILDFLFGRPLWETLKAFGLKVERIGDSYRIVRIKAQRV